MAWPFLVYFRWKMLAPCPNCVPGVVNRARLRSPAWVKATLKTTWELRRSALCTKGCLLLHRHLHQHHLHFAETPR